MSEKHFFDLVRIDVEAADYDHILLALDDVKIAVLVHPRHVARVKPSVAQRDGGLLGAVPVTLHDLRAANAKLAGFADGDDAFSGLEVYDLAFGRREGKADTADLAFGQRRRRMRRRRRLGQAVTFVEHGAAQLLEPLDHLDGQRRRAAVEAAN